MVTTTTGSFRPKHLADALDLLRTIIKEMPTDSEKVRRKAFTDLVLGDEDYKEFAIDAIQKWLGLVYNTAEKSVFPPKKDELKKDAKEAEIERKAQDKAEAEARKEIRNKLIKNAYNVVRNRTFAEAAQMGAIFTKISKFGKPNQIVGDIIDEERFRELVLK